MCPKPKKSLGQHFLIDKNIQNKIIKSLGLGKDDFVLEIGAGRGELTKQIATSVKKIIAVEIDSQLCAILKENLKQQRNVKILHKDILNFDIPHYVRSKRKIKVIGNIPYYISSPIIECLFKYINKITSIFLTVQKEYALRLVAQPNSKDYGSFSCFVQYYTNPKILFLIKRGSFSPPPKVDSAFVKLEVRRKPPVVVKDEKLFFRIIRTAFGKRRKMLRNSLKGLIPQDKIPQNLRPENLSLSDFAQLIS